MRNLKIALVFVSLVLAATMAAQAQQDIQVFVPGNASGYFGNPLDLMVPLVPAIAVKGPGTITVTYVSGIVTGYEMETGPNGTPWNEGTAQLPLQEAHGVAGGKVKNLCALIGAFVPASRVNHSGFTAIDGTKNVAKVGIKPNALFFIGEGKSLQVREAGTLYLGINDQLVSDDGGGFTVEVTGP